MRGEGWGSSEGGGEGGSGGGSGGGVESGREGGNACSLSPHTLSPTHTSTPIIPLTCILACLSLSAASSFASTTSPDNNASLHRGRLGVAVMECDMRCVMVCLTVICYGDRRGSKSSSNNKTSAQRT